MGLFARTVTSSAGNVQMMTRRLDMRRKSDVKKHTKALNEGWVVLSATPTLSAYTEFVYSRTR